MTGRTATETLASGRLVNLRSVASRLWDWCSTLSPQHLGSLFTPLRPREELLQQPARIALFFAHELDT